MTRLTAVRLETPDHPLMGTIPFLLCFDAFVWSKDAFSKDLPQAQM